MDKNQVDAILKSFFIIYDTREHQTKALEERIKSFGCPAQRRHLNFGDYTAACTQDDGSEFCLANIVVVERKQNIDELCTCFTSDRERFVREFERAMKVNAKTYLLVEWASWEKMYAGRYKSKMYPTSLIGSLTTWLARYNCQLLLCEPGTSGKQIRDVQLHEMREALLKIPTTKREYYDDDLLF